VQLFAAAPLQSLQSFAQWLPRHCGLLNSLSLHGHRSGFWDEDNAGFINHVNAAQQLLKLSLQDAVRPPTAAAGMPEAAAAPAAAGAVVAAAPAAAYAAVLSSNEETYNQQQQVLLITDLHAASLQPVNSAAATAVSVPVSNQVASQMQQQQQQQGLHLRSFSSNVPKVVDMVAVLPPDSLSCLQLNLRNATTDSAALAAAIGRLSSLQQLQLYGLPDPSLCTALTALTQLTQLTHLRFSGAWPEQIVGGGLYRAKPLVQPVAAALQQLLAQPLPLKELVMWLSDDLPELDMARLTRLTKLDANCTLPQGLAIPAQLQHARLTLKPFTGTNIVAAISRLPLKQLQHLEMTVLFPRQQQLQLAQLPALQHLRLQVLFTQPPAAVEPLLQLEQLPSLQHLHLAVNFIRKQSLLQLAQLPALQHLKLQCTASAAALATAEAWALLPQLCHLDVMVQDVERDLAAIVLGLAAATSLTELRLGCTETQRERVEVVLFSSLTGLTRLKALSFVGKSSDLIDLGCWQQLASGDTVAALSALTGLTKLSLQNITCGARATADVLPVVCSLKHLQSLVLFKCGLQLGTAEGMACLEAIGRLTQLTHLDLSYNTGLTEQGMMQLTGLSRLHNPAYPVRSCSAVNFYCNGCGVSADASKTFVAALLQQRQ
jgi:hypothetical protein